MRNSSYFLLLALFLAPAFAQNANSQHQRLKVYIDCSHTFCDMTFIKTEINIVDFFLDRLAADVHILITSQNTGSGGRRYQLVFIGQNRFADFKDTLVFNAGANATAAELREILVQYLKIGLVPLIVKTGLIEGLMITMTQEAATVKDITGNATLKDPWNYWIFNISANGNINTDKVYKSYRYNGSISANRTTEEFKTGFSVYGMTNRYTYTFETDTSRENIVVKNSDYGIRHHTIKSINDHWSAGYEAIYDNSTFSNLKGQLYLRTAAEYNIFPYKAVSSKYFTLSYGIIIRFNRYYDTTLYDKLKETLFAHSFEANLTLTKKWGNVSSGFLYSNFLHRWKLNSLGIHLNVNVRITGGLSFYVYSFGGLVHDQVNLPKSGATEEEVLTRRRQLESSYNFQSGFGINYRFGSRLNNFVNPRFTGGNN